MADSDPVPGAAKANPLALAVELPAGVGKQPADKTDQPKGRDHSWQFAAYHTLTSIIGICVLPLPFSAAYLGWTAGILVLLVCTATSFYTGWLLIEVTGAHSTYSAAGDATFGAGFSNKWIRPFQILVFATATIVVCVLGGQTFNAIDDLDGSSDVHLSWWVVIFGVVFFLTTLPPNIDSIWWLSVIGAVAALMMNCFAMGGSAEAISAETDPSFGTPPGSRTDTAFGVMNAFGLQLFAYGGHSVFPDIQSTLPGNDSAKCQGMKKALVAAYAVIVPCYFAVMVLGYAAFGEAVEDNIFTSTEPHVSYSTNMFAYTFVLVNVIAYGNIYVQAAYVLVESMLPTPEDPRIARLVNLMIRVAWMLGATAVAITTPFFGSIAGLSGAVGFTPLTFVYPLVLWNSSPAAENAPEWKKRINIALAVVFSSIAVLATVGATYHIAREAHSYHSY